MRYEYKFVVPNSRMSELKQRILPWVNHDEFSAIAMNHNYTVRSIYFDTPSLTAFEEKIIGLMERQKLRVRVYNTPTDESVGFLEIKTRNNQLGGKYRAKFLTKDLELLFNSKEYERYINDQVANGYFQKSANKFFYYMHRFNMVRVILVTYEREAFQGRFDPALRITFDKSIRYLPYPELSDIYNENNLSLLSKDYFILEVKFNKGFEPWLSKIISEFGLRQQSYSKYCNTIIDCKLHQSFQKSNFMQSSLISSETEKVAV